MFAVSLVVLLIGQSWKSSQDQLTRAIRQSEDDHWTLQVQVMKVEEVSNQVGKVQNSVEDLSKKNDARWNALMSAVPEIEKNIKKSSTPMFAPEWHP